MHLAFTTPRKLPRPRDLVGRVVVLDIAFASEAGSSGFASVTLPFIEGLGSRLRAWVDHHDSVFHARFTGDPRFLLTTKAQHGACPELVTPERVAWAGEIQTICCHVDFDGLCSAAKWIRGGVEPYVGADDDARAIDTRLGEPSERAALIENEGGLDAFGDQRVHNLRGPENAAHFLVLTELKDHGALRLEP